MSCPSWWPRFMSKVRITDDGCWEWTGWIMPNGYAQFWCDGSKQYVHRLAFEVTHGPIPDNHEVDHRCHAEAARAGTCDRGSACRHRRCVNPAHLEAVTHRVNVRRGWSGDLVTACASGHPYTAASTYVKPNGTRACRECRRVANNRSYARRKQAV